MEQQRGKLSDHLRWFEKLHASNAGLRAAFIGQIYNAAAEQMPITAFQSLCDLFVAVDRYVYNLWLVRDVLPDTLRFVPGYNRPN
jgi:hypothetical protein